MMMKHRLSVILVLAMLGLPMAAQHNVDKAAQTDYTPAKKGMPAYYEQNARQLFKQGKWEEGRKYVEEGLEKYDTPSALNELYGQYWLYHEQYDRARFYLVRSLKDDRSNVHTKEMLMKVEEKTHNYSSAIVYCNELLEAAPYNFDLWKKKIELYRLDGNSAEASRLLSRLLEIYPDKKEAKQEVEGDLETKYRNYRKKNNLVGQEETLRKLVDLNPKNMEYEMALCNLLLRSGRTEEAVDAAGYAATIVASPYRFVEKRASILAGMSRYAEALSYLRSVQSSIPRLAGYRKQLRSLMNNLELEAARAAAQSDPYTAYGKIYERTHSDEALNYLLNTSMTRGYLDDALMYIREARRRRGDTQKLLYREYIVQRRLGNTRAATAMLERIHQRWPDNQDANEELCAIRLEEVRRMMDLGQWVEAAEILEELAGYKVDDDTKYGIERRLFTCYARAGLRHKASAQLEKLNCSEKMAAELYEEVTMPYIKQLIAQGRVSEADDEIQRVIDKGNPSADILQIAISTALQMNNTDKARALVERGKKEYPDDPIFMLKDAQLTVAEGNYAMAYDMLYAMKKTYSGDSAVIGAYVECCEALAMRYSKASGYDAALRLINEALDYRPNSQELILDKAMILEKRKDWEQAIEMYRRYRPPYYELGEYNRHMETLKRHLWHNQVMLDYQKARPSGEDKITSQATIAYTKVCRRNSYTLGMIYAGRDGYSNPLPGGDDEGGSGVQLSGEWQHEWDKKLTTNITAGFANKFLPKLKLGIEGSYTVDDFWTAKGNMSYRLIGSGNKTSLVGAGVGAARDISSFNLGADIHVFAMMGEDTEYLASKLSVNGSVMAKCYPVSNRQSYIYVTGSMGNAPELSLIDTSMPVKFNQLNTMLGFGGLYNVNSMIDLGLSGSWYTMSVSSDADTQGSSHTNYLYLNANVTIHF